MPKISTEPILVGCELFVRRGDTLLLGLRGKACFGAGTWALPGGHLEFGEKLAEALCREAKEELGADIEASELRIVSIVDDPRPELGTHYVHISFETKDPSWEPQIAEPESCDEWRYFPLDKLPQDIFEPHQAIIQNYLHSSLYRA
jgi:8-oxo-dGTP diphosphatase